MDIIKMKTEDVFPYLRNAKLHSPTQVANVAESIKQFGFVQPIVIDKDNNVIIGHCRLEAAKHLGLDDVPVVKLETLTPEQANKLRLLDNKLNESAWDFELLAEDVPQLNFDGFDLDWGISFDDGVPEEIDNELIEDTVPEEVTTRCKKGDVWKLGSHRLMCGDSTSAIDVNKLMSGDVSNMVFTDPPYGYNYQSNKRVKSEKFEVIANDDKILDFFPNLKTANNGFIFVCTTWKVLSQWLALFNNYYDLSNMIIWDKGGGGIGDLKKTFFTDYEIILCANNGKEITGKRIGSVWKCGKDNAVDYVHPTQKPVELSAIAIQNTTNKNDIVLDLFGGSGSTLIACEQLNRKCRMMEFDEHYCDVILQRWEDFTGQKAELLTANNE